MCNAVDNHCQNTVANVIHLSNDCMLAVNICSVYFSQQQISKLDSIYDRAQSEFCSGEPKGLEGIGCLTRNTFIQILKSKILCIYDHLSKAWPNQFNFEFLSPGGASFWQEWDLNPFLSWTLKKVWLGWLQKQHRTAITHSKIFFFQNFSISWLHQKIFNICLRSYNEKCQ